jgi:hypothetical protein
LPPTLDEEARAIVEATTDKIMAKLSKELDGRRIPAPETATNNNFHTEEIVRSHYAMIDYQCRVIVLSSEPTDSTDYDCLLERVVIDLSGKIISVKGDEIHWGWALGKKKVSDLKELPENSYVKYGYATLYDSIVLAKSSYVEGYYKKVQRTRFNAFMDNYTIIDKRDAASRI